MMLFLTQGGGFSIPSQDSLFFVPFGLQTKSTASALLLQPLGLALSLCVIHIAKGELLWKCLSFIFAYHFIGKKQGSGLHFQVVGTFYIYTECGPNKQPSCMPVLCWNRSLKNSLCSREIGLNSKKRKSRMELSLIPFI